MTQKTVTGARDRLIVALDFPNADSALRMVARLRGRVGMFKVGLELFVAEGPAVARRLAAEGESVFLDLKLHDIPNTVRAAAQAAAQTGATLLDVHASGGRRMMEAALEGVRAGGDSRHPRLLAVTILTSVGAQELSEIGVASTPESAVVRLARLVQVAGLDGVVASPREASSIRAACGPDFLIVTPGIRPATASRDDQARVATPASAIRAGADFLVVGRPITRAADPAAAAEVIVGEIEQALMLGRTPEPLATGGE